MKQRKDTEKFIHFLGRIRTGSSYIKVHGPRIRSCELSKDAEEAQRAEGASRNCLRLNRVPISKQIDQEAKKLILNSELITKVNESPEWHTYTENYFLEK